MKEYKGKDIAIIWKPELCQHSTICWRTLPQVYNPKERPWIKPLNATTDELVTQINACPSGALTYRRLSEEEKATA